MLFNEPKLLKYYDGMSGRTYYVYVSVLFNEPKLLKSKEAPKMQTYRICFSALQRAEIAEIQRSFVMEV